MGGILSVTIGLFFEQYGKKDVVIHFRPKFYCRYLDDTYNRRNKSTRWAIWKDEVNPSKFLDTNLPW